MLKRPFTKHTPPPHPNWTGRSHRTSQEAFGSQLHFGQESPAVTRWHVAIYVVCAFAVAVVALILKGEA